LSARTKILRLAGELFAQLDRAVDRDNRSAAPCLASIFALPA